MTDHSSFGQAYCTAAEEVSCLEHLRYCNNEICLRSPHVIYYSKRRVREIGPSEDASSADDGKEEYGVHDTIEGMEANNVL